MEASSPSCVNANRIKTKLVKLSLCEGWSPKRMIEKAYYHLIKGASVLAWRVHVELILSLLPVT